MQATRAAALTRMARRYATIYVPEQGLHYRVRSINERERQQWAAGNERDQAQGQDFSRERLIVLCVVDEQGEPLFQDGDVAALAGDALDSAVTARLYLACLEHCSPEQGDAEELEKNSGRIPTGGSP